MKLKKLVVVIGCLFAIISPLHVSNVYGTDVIKVGYIDYASFIEEDNGVYVGYGVSYLNNIANYTGYKYEYVYGTWQEILEKLYNHEIDLIATAQHTKSREENYCFNDISIGDETTVIYAKESNDNLYYEDFEHLDGCRVGLLKDSFQNEAFYQYANDNNFRYSTVEYSTDNEMKDALKNEDVDIIVTGSLSLHDKNMKTIAKFGSDPFYFMSYKGNEGLMDEIDEAIKQITIKNPNYRDELYQQFYRNSIYSSTPLFTRQEIEYINKGDILDIYTFNNRKPLSYEENGEFLGIMPDFLDLISKKSGLKFNLIGTTFKQYPLDKIKNKDVNLMIGLVRSQERISDQQLYVSSTIINGQAVVVGKKGIDMYSLDGVSVIIPKGYEYMESYLLNNYENIKLQYGIDVLDCLDKVNSNEVEVTVYNSYMMNYWLQRPVYKELSIAPIPIEEKLSIVGNGYIDDTLKNIIDKSINVISDDEFNQIISKNTIALSYQTTLYDRIYESRYALLVFVVSLIIIISLIIAMILRRNKTIMQKREKDLLIEKSQLDNLTKVYNKDTFYTNTKDYLLTHDGDFVIMTINIDRFKVVNDLFGVSFGNELLSKLALVLKNIKDIIIVGRISGDNFALLVKDSIKDLDNIIKKMDDFISNYPLDMQITLRYGIYQIEDKKMSISIMIDRANMAANKVRGNYLQHVGYFEASQRKSLLKEQEILNEMRQALNEGQFQVYIQPKVDMKTNAIVGGEALVRWIHPTKKFISPSEFVPIFEKNGFIVNLDTYVWNQTSKAIFEMKEMGLKTVPISLNVSRMNFYRSDLVKVFKGLVEKYGLSYHDLQLEVTESVYTKDTELIYGILQELQSLGFEIAMDDFGSGYSSLNMLKEAPLDVVKLDLKFLSNTNQDDKSLVILQSVISLSHQLGLDVLAEGVEYSHQAKQLLKMGCPTGQGYLYSKPVCIKEFIKMLQRGYIDENNSK